MVEFDVLVFGAHPDDAEMAMGGTIAKLAKAGKRSLIVSLTRGESATHGDARTREEEAARAAATLGCSHRLLDFPDTRVEVTLEGRERLMALIREARPQIVFAPCHTSSYGHHDGAAHVDHLATGALVRDAVKLARIRGMARERPSHEVKRLYYYMVPRDRRPDVLVDVTQEFDLLVRAIQAYDSQMRIERQGNHILQILETYRRFQGIAAGCTYAEAFLCEEALRADAETLFQL